MGTCATTGGARAKKSMQKNKTQEHACTGSVASCAKNGGLVGAAIRPVRTAAGKETSRDGKEPLTSQGRSAAWRGMIIPGRWGGVRRRRRKGTRWLCGIFL